MDENSDTRGATFGQRRRGRLASVLQFRPQFRLPFCLQLCLLLGLAIATSTVHAGSADQKIRRGQLAVTADPRAAGRIDLHFRGSNFFLYPTAFAAAESMIEAILERPCWELVVSSFVDYFQTVSGSASGPAAQTQTACMNTVLSALIPGGCGICPCPVECW